MNTFTTGQEFRRASRASVDTFEKARNDPSPSHLVAKSQPFKVIIIDIIQSSNPAQPARRFSKLQSSQNRSLRGPNALHPAIHRLALITSPRRNVNQAIRHDVSDSQRQPLAVMEGGGREGRRAYMPHGHVRSGYLVSGRERKPSHATPFPAVPRDLLSHGGPAEAAYMTSSVIYIVWA